MIEVFKSKIHKGTVTGSNVDYMGSVTIDPDLIEAANMVIGEKVHVLSMNNGARLETYVISGERGSGEIIINGPAALRIMKGDQVIIISYVFTKMEDSKKINPTIIFPEDKTNKIKC
jgi:aspartate 1-decarboxylase